MSIADNPSPATDSPSNGNTLDLRLLQIAFVVVLGSTMSILDTTIVNVAINALSRDFNVSLATVQWVSTAYMLALATVIPITGWASDRFGTKRLYITSIAVFLAGSALSGCAWSDGSLILFRVLQGLGGGIIVPAGMTILTHAAGPQRIGRVMGIVGVPMLLAPILGPIVGGYLVDDVSWRWIFFVNLPIGAVALVAAIRTFTVDRPALHHALDWKGLLLLSPGLAIFVYGLSATASANTLGRAIALCALGIGLVLVILFAHRARHVNQPLIDVRLFARRVVGASALTTFLFGAAFFGLALPMALYFQIVCGQSASTAGLHLAAQGLGAMITMPLAGRLTDKIGAGPIVLAGLITAAIGSLALSRIGFTTPLWCVELALFVTGLGTGATMMPAMSAALGSLRRNEVARVTSGLNVMLRIGGSIGTALSAVILTRYLSHLLPAAASDKAALSLLRSMPLGERHTILPGLANAFAHAFRWSFAITLLALISALFLPRKAFPAVSVLAEPNANPHQ